MTKKPILLMLTPILIPSLAISCTNGQSNSNKDIPKIINNPKIPGNIPGTQDSSSSSNKDNQHKSNNSDTNTTPNNEAQKVKISYVDNNKVVKEIEHTKGEVLKLFSLMEFTKEKHKLVGYYLDNKFANELPHDFKPIADTKIFLKYEKIENTVFVEKDYKLVSLVALNLKNQSVKIAKHNDIDYIDLDQFVELAKDVLAINDSGIKDALYNGKLYKLKRSLKVEKTNNSFTLKSVKQYISSNNERENITKESYIKFDYLKQEITVSGFDFFDSVKPYQPEAKLEFYEDSNNKFTEFKIDLQKYKIDILSKNDKLYLPFVMLNQLILGESENQLYFNGDKVYIFEFNQVHDHNNNDSKMKLLSNAKDEPIPLNYRDFEYNYLLFLLDTFYPIKPQGNSSYNDFLKQYKNDILSDDNITHFMALNYIIYDLDDIHTKVLLWGHQYVSNLEKQIEVRDSDELKERRKRFKQYESELLRIEERHNLNEATVRYTKDNQTAIIKIDILTRYTTDGLKKQLLEAKDKGAKNIIFDLTLNRGGSVQATWEILGYLTNQKFKYNKFYPLTKDKTITNIKSEVWQPEFNFKYFILNSPINYSAGNMFAAVAKNNNLAKIIGYKSAGGASEVRISVLPTGTIIRRSGNYTLCNLGFNSYEFGVEPDIEFDKKNDEYDLEKLFDLEYIEQVVNKSNN
ncbi:Hypothetical protein, predicted lipoprotein [Mycoplasmopsis agalactiae 14628]|uniref:Tail specific protease domain-containing protein n=1 Tax=Mycoplasmopsis agalactiae 14628 TaxID=1110504 RepID=I5D6K4_MYCAA|nr:S41 family peptidase [Mycoplasmopsis agalactiae]EIN15313.1 Hypothetical protein, predicted lipoprotein [Mycoplasmopsis agalactiae 14628]